MRSVRWMACLWLSSLAVAGACGTKGTSGGGAATGTGTGASGADCPPCAQDSDCADAKSHCGQVGGDFFCVPSCANGETCGAGRTCTPVNTADGSQISLCVMDTGECSNASMTSSVASSGSGDTCGSLVGPDVSSSCKSCTMGASGCQANGCYGGWWCNTTGFKCQSPPSPASCGGGSTSASSGVGGSGGSVGPTGGTLDTLDFAVVGDTRPATEGDIAGYPTAVVTKIWQDVEASSPRPAFAVTTGDYQFSNPFSNEASAQIDLYLAARATFSNLVFPAMGNHECTGGTASNCGSGNTDGITQSYSLFLAKLLGPIGQTKPYYEIDVGSTGGDWTSKFVFVAANAWDATQASWLSTVLAKPTTYTFVVRHESSLVTTAPGVSPSEQIMAQHPYTLSIVGHTHTYGHYASTREVVIGNGGAPPTGSVNYGYVVARQRHSDNAIQFWSYDYASGAVVDQFNLKPDGSAAP